jgi:exosortase/archaeosortase family protein
MIGFLLIGGAAITRMQGARWLKLAWLATGIALMWAVDLVRILLILSTAKAFGESFAIDTIHPVVGMIFVSLAVLAMIRVLPVFGLRLAVPHFRLKWPSPSPRMDRRSPAVRRATVALAVVGLAGTFAASANFGLQRYQLLAEDLGTPRLQPATVARATIPGWTISWSSRYPWVSTYFGTGSSWDRYVYAPKPTAVSSVVQRSVFLDLISTGDLLTFSTYGLEACYRFHNYDVLYDQKVQLGGGLIGHEVTYHIRSDNSAWTAVYWEWPVHTPTADRYERIILSVSTEYKDASTTREHMRTFATEVVAASASRATSESAGSL